MPHQIEETILINSDCSSIWETLTQPALMKEWMGEPAMELDIQTD